jgi:hypothetical protein
VTIFALFYKLKKPLAKRAYDGEVQVPSELAKNSGTLVRSSFRGVYENLFLVKSKSFLNTSAHNFLCAGNYRRAIGVAER